MKGMKRLLILLMVSMLILSGCSSKPNEAEDAKMTAGYYTASASGYAGEVEVGVEVDDKSILKVEVLSNNETPSVGGMAIDQLPNQIVDTQSIALDGVSGATYTSKAILEAVKDCLNQAGAELSQFEKEKEEVKGQEIELNREVVIVGAGSAGLSAALRLNGLGHQDVLVLEKMAYTGGASATCGGGFLAAGSKYQQDGSNPEMMTEFLLKKGHNINDVELTKLHSENAATTIDWLIDEIGIEFNAPSEGSLDFVAVGGGAGMMNALHEVAMNQGVEIQLNTQATELIVENGKVVGVKAKDDKGNTYLIHAQAVLLATGGYGNNQELIKSANVGRVIYYGPVSSNGEGLLMAQKLGAKVTNLQYLGVKPNGLEITEGVGKYTQPANNAMWKNSAGISVNEEGKRVVNETSGEEALVNAYKEQNDWAMYTVMDQAAYDVFYNAAIEKHLFSAEEAEKWIDEKGDGITVFVKGENLEDAAKQAGIDPEELAKTIDSYNEGFKKGEDEFGRNLVSEFDLSGSIYIVKQNLRFATSLGGLDINTSCQVLLENDEAIEGLYAAGEVVGNVQGDVSAGYLSWGATSGKVAAESIDALLN